jgi:pyridoxal 5'-phosphate synthase pdxT subunit
MIIGILGIQGNISEHVVATQKALSRIDGEGGKSTVRVVKKPGEMKDCDALIMPGGESTTFWKLMMKTGIFETIKEFSKTKPIWGTCAGLVMMAKHGDGDVSKTGQELLGIMDITVDRNAFGRQVDSFSTKLDIKEIGPFECIFIRAPVIEKAGKGVEVLAEYKGKIVAARQGNLLATSFHPDEIQPGGT